MSRSNKLSLNQKGISIIEAMLAVAILMIGILVTINIFPAALKISKNAEQETVAANLAQAKIEEMFSLGYENITIGTIETKHRLSADSANPFYNFQRQTVTTYVDGNLANSVAATGLKKVSVTVYWIAPSLGAEKNSTFSVLISQR